MNDAAAAVCQHMDAHGTEEEPENSDESGGVICTELNQII